MRRVWLLPVVLLLFAGCGGGRLEKNKAIARGYLTEVLLEGQWDRWDRYFPETIVFNGAELTREEIIRNADIIHRAFPDFELIIEDQIAEEDRVATRITFTGTHSGEFMGIPATGNRVVYRGIAMDRIIDGKVIEMWHEADTWAMLQQMGVR